MPKFKDLSGLKFNRLKVIEYVGRSKWKVLCDCGNIKEVLGHYLTVGLTKSCGCLKDELFKIRATKHGLTRTGIYNSWRGMKERCTNPKHKNYGYYSQVGMVEEWKCFENFLQDMKESYIEGLEIDRIDNSLGYSKDNCKWSTRSEQCLNQEKAPNTSSKFRGVCFNKINKNWRAYVVNNGKHVNVGSFSSELEAAKAVDKFIIEHNLPNRRNFNE